MDQPLKWNSRPAVCSDHISSVRMANLLIPAEVQSQDNYTPIFRRMFAISQRAQYVFD